MSLATVAFVARGIRHHSAGSRFKDPGHVAGLREATVGDHPGHKPFLVSTDHGDSKLSIVLGGHKEPDRPGRGCHPSEHARFSAVIKTVPAWRFAAASRSQSHRGRCRANAFKSHARSQDARMSPAGLSSKRPGFELSAYSATMPDVILSSKVMRRGFELPTIRSSSSSCSLARMWRRSSVRSPFFVSERVTLRRSYEDGLRLMKPFFCRSLMSGLTVDLSRAMARPSALCEMPGLRWMIASAGKRPGLIRSLSRCLAKAR